jgi:hypothetical protein
MSVQVLVALIDPELVRSMSTEQIDAATTALRCEIESDRQLKERLYRAIAPSVSKYLAVKVN